MQDTYTTLELQRDYPELFQVTSAEEGLRMAQSIRAEMMARHAAERDALARVTKSYAAKVRWAAGRNHSAGNAAQ